MKYDDVGWVLYIHKLDFYSVSTLK